MIAEESGLADLLLRPLSAKILPATRPEREGLVDRIWQWKEQYEKRITGQLKQLGCSCDWDR